MRPTALIHPGSTDWPQVASTVLIEDGRLESLVDNLLALTRLEEGVRRTPVHTHQRLEGLARGAVEDRALRIAQRRLEPVALPERNHAAVQRLFAAAAADAHEGNGGLHRPLEPCAPPTW